MNRISCGFRAQVPLVEMLCRACADWGLQGSWGFRVFRV